MYNRLHTFTINLKLLSISQTPNHVPNSSSDSLFTSYNIDFVVLYIIFSKKDVTDTQIFDMKCRKLLGAILSVFAHKVVLCQNSFEVSGNIK